MPFRSYAKHFGPDQLANMQAAFDATWTELSDGGMTLGTEEEVAVMKRKLAQRILVSASAGGVRDVDTLKHQALRSLRRGFRRASEAA